MWKPLLEKQFSGEAVGCLSFSQTRDHLSKAQRGLVGDGVSEVMTKLRVTSSDGTSYSGDLLAIVDVLKNMTEIFRRSYYSPSSADMRVSAKHHLTLRDRESLPLFHCTIFLLWPLKAPAAVKPEEQLVALCMVIWICSRGSLLEIQLLNSFQSSTVRTFGLAEKWFKSCIFSFQHIHNHCHTT